MPRLFLMRHGATEWSGIRYSGRSDLALNDVGRIQVQATAAYLRSRAEGSGAIVASPLRRSRESAELLAQTLHWPITLDEDLQEVDFGELEGAAFDELQTRWPNIARSLKAGLLAVDWPGGETSVQLHRRASTAWARLATAETDVAVVTHGGPIGVLLDLALDGEGSQPRPILRPAQVCVLERGPRWTVLEIWPP